MEYESISHAAQPKQHAAQTGGRGSDFVRFTYGLILNWIIIVSTSVNRWLDTRDTIEYKYKY